MNLLLLKTIWTLIETKYTWIKIKNHIKNSRSDSVTRWTWAFETERPRLNWREINWKYKRIIVRNLKSSIILQPALVFLQIFNKHPNITNNALERERERGRDWTTYITNGRRWKLNNEYLMHKLCGRWVMGMADGPSFKEWRSWRTQLISNPKLHKKRNQIGPELERISNSP
jgi:hypothetical protein